LINDLGAAAFDQPVITSVSRLHLMSIRSDQKKSSCFEGIEGFAAAVRSEELRFGAKKCDGLFLRSVFAVYFCDLLLSWRIAALVLAADMLGAFFVRRLFLSLLVADNALLRCGFVVRCRFGHHRDPG
jgi:hypothetical protein